jgi:hypothetical protein
MVESYPAIPVPVATLSAAGDGLVSRLARWSHKLSFLKRGQNIYPNRLIKDKFYKKVTNSITSLLSRHQMVQPFRTRNDPKTDLTLNPIDNYKGRGEFIVKESRVSLIAYLPNG